MLVAVSLLLLLLLVTLAAIRASPLNEPLIKDNSHWQKLANFTIDDSEIELSKYISSKTGEL